MQWLGVFLSLASLITSGQLVTVRPDVGPAFGVDLASGRKIAHTSPDPLSELSPNGQHLAFVRENNLWISLANGKQPRPLTHNGGVNVLVGLPDVVYGREFNVTRHYWWSPDSLSLAYIETEFMNADHYIAAGGNLPFFRLRVVEVETGRTRTVAESNAQWTYLLRVAWAPDSRRLVFYRMNRLQNTAELCVADDVGIKVLLTEKDLYWVNAPETPVFVEGGKRLVVSSERSGSKHIYLYESDGRLVRDLTAPGLEVYQLHQEHDESNIYLSGSEGTHQERHLFRLAWNNPIPEQVTRQPGWHEVSLNADGSAYLDCYSSLQIPPSYRWYGLRGATREVVAPAVPPGKPVDNEFFTIRTHDNVALPARLFKPDHFDRQKKYPLILYTFSGPQGRVVADNWGGWQMECNRELVRLGYLVLALDARGSGGYGHLFEEYIHYRFGAQEVADIREVVSYLRQLAYVDADRLGIWGCDYGAHTVVHAMWQFPGGFKAGFAVSPITDWTKYDAYFTERYLGLPAQRFNEYNDSTPLQDARKMTGTLMVTAPPDHPLILPVHLEALEKAMAGVKRQDVRKRLEVAPWSSDPQKRVTQLTNFFAQTL